jgi:para-nitrobenzyl esterase
MAALLLLLFATVTATAARSTELGRADDVVETRQGAVQGIVADGYRAFLGIPYAAPPVGDLRWRAPAAPAAWTGVRDGTYRRADCVQIRPRRPWFVPTDEDCLHLNVWTPHPAPGSAGNGSWPVVVFFPGGNQTQGGIGVHSYDGSGLVAATQAAVVVMANYRLNVFGFLGGAALAAESSDGANGNYGILDQWAALGWVRDNIASFGGDPARVTIMGESAGSWDVQYHLVFPRSAGLFHAAIMESGASHYRLSQVSQAEAHATYDSLAAALGCATLACLRAIPAKDLGQRVALTDYRWMATVDGVELRGRVVDLVQAGAFTRVPVLIGSNEDEMPAIAPRRLSEAAYRSLVARIFGPTNAARLLPVYPVDAYASPWFALQQVLTDGMFTCITRRNALWMAAYTPVYTYYFTHTLGVVEQYAPSLGAFHTTELPFVFRVARLFRTADDATVADHLGAYWTHFAATGDPNTGPSTDPHRVPLAWPVFSSNATTATHLVLQAQPALRTALKATECAVWDDIQDLVNVDAARAVLSGAPHPDAH